jgi:CRISPR-associated protein Cas5d
LKPIRFTSLRRNEVASKVPATNAARVMKAGRGNLGLYIEDDRQQRAASILRDVGYVIEARFEIIGGEPNAAKHLDQFNRRARDGRCFHRPYLGCREFPADFELVETARAIPPVSDELRGDLELGYILHDIDFAKGMSPRFFRATLRDGVLHVPPFEAQEAAQ